MNSILVCEICILKIVKKRGVCASQNQRKKIIQHILNTQPRLNLSYRLHKYFNLIWSMPTIYLIKWKLSQRRKEKERVWSLFIDSVKGIISLCRGGCRGLPLLPMQHLKRLTLISRAKFSFLKKILKFDWKKVCATLQWARRWYWLEDKIFLAPFLTQFAILCNVLSVLASFPATNIQIFWAARCVLF